jgi:hypothetical protein
LGAFLTLVRKKASPVLLNEFAELVDATVIAEYVADMRRAREQKRSGTVTLTSELAFGDYADGWTDTHLRPRRSAT